MAQIVINVPDAQLKAIGDAFIDAFFDDANPQAQAAGPGRKAPADGVEFARQKIIDYVQTVVADADSRRMRRQVANQSQAAKPTTVNLT